MKDRLSSIPHARALLALASMLALGCVFHQEGAFFRWSTHRDMLREIAVDGILACGMTLVILSGGIDLAVSSILALSAVSFALFTIALGWGPFAAVAAVLAIGVAAGTASGALVARFRLQPFIVTLAMMVFARGLAKRLAGGKKVTAYTAGSGGLPRIFDLLDARVLDGNVAIVTLVFLAAVGVTWVILRRLRLGRWLYAVGGNAEAARRAGISVTMIRLAVFTLAGTMAATGGIIAASRLLAVNQSSGSGDVLLNAIAAAVIGGTSLSAGGMGTVAGTIVGALIIGVLNNTLDLMNVSAFWQQIVKGCIIVGAVILDQLKNRGGK
jgi:ribose transport system permease protein